MSPASDPPAGTPVPPDASGVASAGAGTAPGRQRPPIALPARRARAALPSLAGRAAPRQSGAGRRADGIRCRGGGRRLFLRSGHRPMAATGRSSPPVPRAAPVSVAARIKDPPASMPASHRVPAASMDRTRATASPGTRSPRVPGSRRAASPAAATRSRDSPSAEPRAGQTPGRTPRRRAALRPRRRAARRSAGQRRAGLSTVARLTVARRTVARPTVAGIRLAGLRLHDPRRLRAPAAGTRRPGARRSCDPSRAASR